LLNGKSPKLTKLLKAILNDDEIKHLHSYANVVSVRRLGFNDHGSVHARIVTKNALAMLDLLKDSGVQTSLENEEVGTYEDSQIAVTLGAFLHDVGMGVGRQDHEKHSINLADQIIARHLEGVYPKSPAMRIALRSMVHECIIGHMAKTAIHSVEAGTVLAADGTDMAGGRSRIPQLLSGDPVVGDMHRYSAASIKKTTIGKGKAKAISIRVDMDSDSGLFQIEQVLMTKLKASPILGHIELIVCIEGQDPLQYL